MQLNGIQDHIYLSIGARPNYNLSDFARNIKPISSTRKYENHLSEKIQYANRFLTLILSTSQVNRMLVYFINQKRTSQELLLTRSVANFLIKNIKKNIYSIDSHRLAIYE